MKNPQKITKIHLTVNDQDKPVILGIVTPDQDYKLSMKINREMSVSLRNILPIEIQDETGTSLTFSRFSTAGSDNAPALILVSNRFGQNFLINKLKNIDFLLLINDATVPEQIEKTITSLRAIESVSGVFKIDFRSIAKDRNIGNLF